MADQLDAPLGRKKKRRNERAGRFDFQALPLARIGLGVLVLIGVGVAARLMLVDDPQGGRPSLEISIASNTGSNEIATKVGKQPTADMPDVQAITLNAIPGITTIGDETPDALPNATGLAALHEFGVIPELVEETSIGNLPRTGTDGQTPFTAYARASITPGETQDKPLIAIVITGMGLSESGTIDAIEKLPDNITLAFAPYGRTLKTTTSAARNGGHELLLEMPLEPFDYPENDPGPQTLLTGQPARANLDRMFWLMARLGGYLGIINNMGARFTASAADFNPVMEELAVRGLGYVDDGSSNRSLAGNLAQTNHVPFVRADEALDSNPSRAAILTALDALEAKATANGHAVGVASALPVSVQTIADWAQKLDDRGFTLVPVSALMASTN